MWYHWIVFLSLGSSVALRVNEAAARVKENEGGVTENANKYTVRIALSRTESFAETGSPIEFAVNGVRRLTRITDTYPGKSVVLQHIRRGNVVIAYVDAVKDACAYWVGGGVEHCTVGGWNLNFAISDESDEYASVYDAYVSLMGIGGPVTMKVNYTVVAVYAAQPNQLLVYPGLLKGTQVQAIGPLGDNCTYIVGNEKMKCFLNESWGLAMGSEVSYFHAEDEGVHEDGKTKTDVEVETTKNYTVELEIEPEKTGHFKVIDIELNGHGIAHKMSATEDGKPIVVYHVKSGSVLTAVSHLIGKACSIYIVAGMRSLTCAGWKLNLNVKEENEKSFANGKLFDTVFSVTRWSREAQSDWKIWKIKADGVELASSAEEQRAPITWGGLPEKTRVVPWVNDVESEEPCTHAVGSNATVCSYGGWKFSMHSQLNMNIMGNEHHWDWEVDHTSDDELDDGYDGDTFAFSVNATDTSGSKSKLECVAHEYLELNMVEFDNVETAPVDEKSRKIYKNHFLFKTRELVFKERKPRGITVQAIILSAYFRGTYDEKKDHGFICTVYNDEWEVLCTADTNGMSRTYADGCTLKIEKLDD